MERYQHSSRRHNALKHGAFVKQIMILKEDQYEFDRLRKDVFNELQPNGRIEEDVALDIAKLKWRKYRIERLSSDEILAAQLIPGHEDLQMISWIYQMLSKEWSQTEILQFLRNLPDSCHQIIERECHVGPNESHEAWFNRVKKCILDLFLLAKDAITDKRNDPVLLGEVASKIRGLTEKQLLIEERLDLMIDRALKRLAIVKTFKEVMVTQASGIALKKYKSDDH
jgi:hypothetical protein